MNQIISQPDFETILGSVSSIELGQVFANYLKDAIITQRGKEMSIFRITDLTTWEQITKDEFMRMSLKLLTDSSNHWINELKAEKKERLDDIKNSIMEMEKEREELTDKAQISLNTKKEKAKKKELALSTDEYMGKIKQVANCKYLKVWNFERDILKMLLIELMDNNIVFDSDSDGIHFLNGRFDLIKGEFSERQPTHYISTLGKNSYNYEEPTEHNEAYMMNEISKLFNTIEDRDYTLYLLGSVLSGRFSKQQIWLFFYGLGGCGKSFLIDLFAACAGDQYVKMFQKETFSKNCPQSERNKTLNSINPNIRIYKINELESKTIDKNLIKQFADGEIETVKLYKDGSHLLKILGILVIISNEMVSFNGDTGVNRRLTGYEFKNTFTDNKALVDNKTVFYNDRNFIDKLSISQKVAFFHILAQNCKMWYNKEEVKKSKGYIDTTTLITSVNDFWGEVIDNCFEVSQTAYDWVAVDEILDVIYSEFPQKKKTIHRKHVISGLKGKGYEFNKDKMINKCKKGAFKGLIIKCEEENDHIENPFFKEDTQTTNLKNEIERLKQELEEAHTKINLLTIEPKKEEPKETPKVKQQAKKEPKETPKIKNNKPKKPNTKKPKKPDIAFEFIDAEEVEL